MRRCKLTYTECTFTWIEFGPIMCTWFLHGTMIVACGALCSYPWKADSQCTQLRQYVRAAAHTSAMLGYKFMCLCKNALCSKPFFERRKQICLDCMKWAVSLSLTHVRRPVSCSTCLIGLMRSTLAFVLELFEDQPPMRYLFTYSLPLCQNRIEY